MLLLVVLGSAAAGPVAAQVPRLPEDPPPDTVPADTVPADTVVLPPPGLPGLDPVGPIGWTRGIWEWDRADLMRLPDISLVQLLQRVPGITPVRTAHAVHSEGAAVFGAAGAGTRYVIDGFEVDPLLGPTFDPTRIPLLALESVRVERGVTGATIRIRTMTPDDPRTRTTIEAGTGDYSTNVFRGTFLAPRVLGGSLGVGFERTAADRIAGGAASHTAGWLKWTFARDSAGVQLEYRQSDMERSGIPPGLSGDRHDWAVRARALLGGVATEAYVGAGAQQDERGALTLREGAPQAGVRARGAIDGPVPAEARLSFRFRDHPGLPRGELELESWAAPAPWVGLGISAVQGWWADGQGSGRASGHIRLSPLAGVRVFADIERGAALLGGGPGIRVFGPGDSLAFTLERNGLRAGAEVVRGRARLGAALVVSTADSVAGFGFDFDLAAPRLEGGEAVGWEVIAVLPTGWDPLHLEGWWTAMDRPAHWVYLPDHQWRAALVYHHRPLPSGNAELYARIENAYRGRMGVPSAGAFTTVAPYRATNIELSIRVLTVTAFFRWDNILHRQLQEDLPDSRLPGQHVLYGVKWVFWN